LVSWAPARHGRATIGEAAKVTGANRNTVKDRALAERKHLARHGTGRLWADARYA
jgi:hypothetical protein